jgi:hypothetical protein
MSNPDKALATDTAHIGARMDAVDSIRWSPVATVEKYDDDQTAWVANRLGILTPLGAHFEAAGVKPYETLVAAGNLLTTAGLNRLTSLMIAGGGQGATNTATRLGVGNSTTAAAVGQTDLQASAGSANRWFQVMDATYPQQSNGVLTFKSTFATGDGNFVWNEWCVDIGTPTVTSGNTVNANMLNRAVQSLGTKVSGSWVLTATITIS